MNPLYISQKLFEHYENIEEVKDYYGLLAIYGCLLTAEAKEDPVLLEKCQRILSRFPEHVCHPEYNFPSYRIGGLAKAYAVLKGYMPGCEAQVKEYAEEIMTAARDRKGIISNPHFPEKELIWIDVATAVTPYLLFAGLKLDEEKYIDEAARQTFLMYDEFLDKENGLLHQSRNFNGFGRYSEDHWSRGNGWCYIPLTELVRRLPSDSPYRPKSEEYYRALSAALLPYQSERGLWRQEITCNLSYEETSGTAMFLYGIGVGIRLGLLDRQTYFPVFLKGLDGLLKVSINPDFSTENSCPGCLCPGEGIEKGSIKAYVTLVLPHRDEHHSFGPLMLALTEAYLNGVVDLHMPTAMKY